MGWIGLGWIGLGVRASTVAWAPDGQHIACGCINNSVLVYTRNGELRHQIRVHNTGVLAVGQRVCSEVS